MSYSLLNSLFPVLYKEQWKNEGKKSLIKFDWLRKLGQGRKKSNIPHPVQVELSLVVFKNFFISLSPSPWQYHTMKVKLSSNSRSSCFGFLSARITGTNYLAWLHIYIFISKIFFFVLCVCVSGYTHVSKNICIFIHMRISAHGVQEVY